MTNPSTAPRCIWVTLEASEVIELKRIAIDNDLDSAVQFFTEYLYPRVKKAAVERNVASDTLMEEMDHDHISG